MHLTFRQLVIRYAVFAVIATFANLAVQRLVLEGNEGWYVPALMAGTLVGLVVKFILDKQWVFFDGSSKVRDETRKFGIYTLTGVCTTAIFWGSETLFWLIGDTQSMREIGAVLGLTVGYVIKYNLDYRFVFDQANSTDKQTSDG